MADGRHFENRYIAISQRKIIRFRRNFVHSSRFWTRWTSCNQKWKSCTGQTPEFDRTYFLFHKNYRNSTNLHEIRLKFIKNSARKRSCYWNQSQTKSVEKQWANLWNTEHCDTKVVLSSKKLTQLTTVHTVIFAHTSFLAMQDRVKLRNGGNKSHIHTTEFTVLLTWNTKKT